MHATLFYLEPRRAEPAGEALGTLRRTLVNRKADLQGIANFGARAQDSTAQ